jgi:hypothetical protein
VGDIIKPKFHPKPRAVKLDGLRIPADLVDADALAKLGMPRLPKDQRRDVIAYALEAIARAEAALKTARLALEMEDSNGGDAA